MPALIITGSPNITSLDSKIVADICQGNFLIDVSPSQFTAEGISTSGGVQGASIRITNPVGVIIDNYSTSGYDIYPPMTSVYSFPIPLIAGIYQYGTYTIDVRLTDEDGTQYTVTKTVNICPPDSNNKNRNYGCLGADLIASCTDGKVVVLLNAPPTYKGKAATSQVNDLELLYPTESGLDPVETTVGSFSVLLFEGQYKLSGYVCVLYSYGDEVYFKVNYKVKCEKIVYCIIDECCVEAKLQELRLKIDSDCTQKEKEETFSTFVEATSLFALAKMSAQCGTDPSDTIAALEKLLGCQCTCNCNEGTPLINNTPSRDVVIEGCGVVKTVVGLTDHYDINVRPYTLNLNDTSGILSLTDVAEDGCARNQDLDISMDRIQELIVFPTPTSGVDWIYKAVLNQSGTSIPTANRDTRSTVTIAWTRTGVGAYVGTLSGTFTALTATNLFVLMGKTANIITRVNWISANSFSLNSADSSGSAADSLIANIPFVLSIIQ